MSYRHDHYVNYQEMTDLLQAWSKAHPDYMSLESLAKSPEGRDLWIVTLTNSATGPHHEKPAYWIDANTHAGEVTGTQCCLRTIQLLLEERNTRTDLQDLLDHNTFYIVPRISVDGSEYYLTTPNDLRSTKLDFPHPFEEFEGVDRQDLDENGWILTMRFKDPAGEFKVSEKDPRVMIPRAPDDCDPKATYYRVFPEGLFNNYQGKAQSGAHRYGIDLNRQYPHEFKPGGVQLGAGPHPLFIEESRKMVEAICDRPNIVGIQSYHTFSGVVLRPFANSPDSEMNSHDLEVYKSLGKLAKRSTGYDCISTFHDFRYDQKKDLGGGFFEWCYGDRGIVTFTTEIWSLARQAGIEDKNYIQFFFDLPEGYALKTLHWCDENLPQGTYFQEWTEFDHPQLGAIEIGGWKTKFVIQNPPPPFLQKEVDGNVEFTLTCAKSNPRIVCEEKAVEDLGGGNYRISVKMTNTGYLPTNGSEKALEVDVINEPVGKLKLADGQKLVTGESLFHPRHLPGYSRKGQFRNSMFIFAENNLSSDWLEWVVQGSGVVELEINYRRGGIIRQAFELG